MQIDQQQPRPALSHRDQAILEYLHRWRGISQRKGRDYVFPNQELIADETGYSVPTVKRALRSLEAKGYIVRRRTRLGNRYYFLDPGIKMTPAHGSERSLPRDQNDPCAGIKMTPAIQQDKTKEKQQQQQSNHAAADLFSPLEILDARNALLGLGLEEHDADTWAQKDCRLAVVIATYCAREFQKPNCTITNKVGFVIRRLKEPEKKGFKKTESGWLPPADPVDFFRAREREERQRARQQEAARRVQVDLEWKEWKEWKARWEQAGAERRAQVENAVEAANRIPIRPWPTIFERSCIAEFRKQEEARAQSPAPTE